MYQTAAKSDVAFDPAPLPHRRVDWGAARHALARLRADVEGDAIEDFRLAIDGDQGEERFQAFLRRPGARALLRERPDLPGTLDDWATLDRLPPGTLGRRYAELAREDGVRVADIARASNEREDARERAPDAVRRWFADRMVCNHDLLHTLTGYGRDVAGELGLLAFSFGFLPHRIFWVALGLGILGVPPRRLPRVAPYLWRAWRRGRAARIPPDVRWEELLAQPLAEVQQQLGISPLRAVHPHGVWRGGRAGQGFRLEPLPPDRD